MTADEWNSIVASSSDGLIGLFMTHLLLGGFSGLESAAERAHECDVEREAAGFQVGNRAAAGDERILGGQDLEKRRKPAAIAIVGDAIGILRSGECGLARLAPVEK